MTQNNADFVTPINVSPNSVLEGIPAPPRTNAYHTKVDGPLPTIPIIPIIPTLVTEPICGPLTLLEELARQVIVLNNGVRPNKPEPIINNEPYRVIALRGHCGDVVKVSLEDYEKLSKHPWYKHQYGYAFGNIEGGVKTLHRVALGITDPTVFVDHINSDRLDCRRTNLRLGTASENTQNRSKRTAETSSNFHGVYFDVTNDLYRSEFRSNGNRINNGSFKDELHAAIAYDFYVVHNGLDRRQINFYRMREIYLAIPFQKRREKENFKGVTQVGNKFASKIQVNGAIIPILRSENAEACARAYDRFIVEHNIPGKVLNFPLEHPNYNSNKIRILCQEVDETTVRLSIENCMEEVLIDREDYDKVKFYSCHISDGYVYLYLDKSTFLLHRVVMDMTDPMVIIDHKNGNRLNNKKCNLKKVNSW